MSTSVIWRGGAGLWQSALNWSGFAVPDLTDDVTVGSFGTSEIGFGITAYAAALALPGGVVQLDPGGVLRVAGTIALAGGTLDLAGTLSGGTLAAGGTLVGQGGTLDGTVVQGGLAGLADVTITTATATANASLPIAATGTLGLAGGLYDGATFTLDQSAAVGGTVALDAAGTRTVVLGATTQVVGGGTPSAGVVEVLGGGALTNQGTISLAPSSTLETQIVYQPTGKMHALVGTSLTWTESVAPTLDIAAARFVNTGLVALSGGTLDLTGTSFRNTGTVRLADAAAQTVQAAADGTVSVVATTLATSIEVAASVTTFANTGTLAADSIAFDGSVRLALLGTLAGALSFAGTLDLGGGTLAATPAQPVTITGTVLHGTLGGDGLALAGASLRGVVLADGTASASGTLHLLGLGGLTLDAGAVLQAGGTALFAGASGNALVNNGTLAAAAGATVTLQAGLGGAGTVDLGANAAVTVASLALFARPTFLFEPGDSLLSLPGTGAGVTLADLHAGDVLDLASLSSVGTGMASAGIVGGALEVTGASGQTATLALSAPAHGIGFTVTADSHGGTWVAVT